LPSTTAPLQAPTPPVGISTVLTGGTTVVGLVVLILSLFGVQVDDVVTQQIGAALGGLAALVSLVTMVVSRTKQANHLAQLATDVKLDSNDLAASGAQQTVEHLETQVGRVARAVNQAAELNRQYRQYSYGGTDDQAESSERIYGVDDGQEVDESTEQILGAPEDASLEVPAGSVPTTTIPPTA
jgi:hypothetical protein